MNNFNYVNNDLTCRGMNLADLAKKYGTPLWVYDGNQISENYSAVCQAFAPLGAQVRYAVKANDSNRVLSLIRSLGSGFDVVSGGELHRVLNNIGADPGKIVFAGAAKTEDELEMAIRAQICINAESLTEIRAIKRIATRIGYRPKVTLRIAPGIDPHTAAKISTSHSGTKFAIEPNVIEEILSAYHMGDLEEMSIQGIHCHVGSQIHDPQVYVAALDVILPFFAKYGWLYSLDLGGGLPVAYGAPNEEETLPFTAFAEAIGEKLKTAKINDLEFLIEPGRSIVADAGILIVEVETVKMSGGRRIVTVDGGMADVVRPAMYDSYQEIVPLEFIYSRTLADVAGPHCESSDFLGKDRMLPDLQRGDYLAVLTVGAYGRTMSSRYNSSRFAAEVMVIDGSVRICRDREGYDEASRNEHW